MMKYCLKKSSKYKKIRIKVLYNKKEKHLQEK